MDADLIAEVHAFQEVADKLGVQIFRYACVDNAYDVMLKKVAASPLFRACTPSGLWDTRPDGKICHTLMEIKESTLNGTEFVAWLDEWTVAIRNDERIVWSLGLVYPEQLIGFAEWQQTFRDYFRAEGLLAPQPEYVELAVRLPWARRSLEVD
ncbi:MAG: hypothetical protein L0228_09575 [Planctomycetes bacterium]|nr:hypothetical protein [Planctomycetota bacterium]